MILNNSLNGNEIILQKVLTPTGFAGSSFNRIELYKNGDVYWIQYDGAGVDYENIVNYGRNIEGVEVSIMLREMGGNFKASLRANEYVDVSIVASKFAGGGHLRAAGFESVMPREQIVNTLLEELRKQKEELFLSTYFLVEM